MRRFGLAIALSLGVLAFATPATPARADGDAVEAAREQFRDGVALMTAGDFAGALAKFKLVAHVKMNAQVAFNIADCEEHLGKLVSALGNYRLAAQKAQDGSAPQVASVVDARIEALGKRIPRLTLKRVEPVANPRASIQLDGAEIASSQIGKAQPVDPGDRVATVVVDGKVVGTAHLTLAEGEAKTLEITVPAPLVASEGTPGAPAAPSGPSVPGVVLTTAGGASLLLGFVFIGLRQSAISDLDKVCSPSHVCPTSAQSTADRGKVMTGLAEVTIPVGVAALTTGIVLLATHKRAAPSASSEASSPVGIRFGAPGADGPGLSLRGRF